MKKENYPQGNRWNKLPIKVSQKDFNRYIGPFLSSGKRGPDTKISRYKIFNYILYLLHTGVQWNQLITTRKEISWSGIYYHHNRWSKDGSYKNLFETSVMFLQNKNMLDTSILHGDGSNTVAKKGVKESATVDTNIRKV